MVTEGFVLEVVKECNKDRVKTLAEFIAMVFQGKFIEIYCNHCSHIVFHLFLLYIYNIVTYCKVQSCYAYTMRI